MNRRKGYTRGSLGTDDSKKFDFLVFDSQGKDLEQWADARGRSVADLVRDAVENTDLSTIRVNPTWDKAQPKNYRISMMFRTDALNEIQAFAKTNKIRPALVLRAILQTANHAGD